jgi:transcriptional regulator of aromatic amino acid metabolism
MSLLRRLHLINLSDLLRLGEPIHLAHHVAVCVLKEAIAAGPLVPHALEEHREYIEDGLLNIRDARRCLTASARGEDCAASDYGGVVGEPGQAKSCLPDSFTGKARGFVGVNCRVIPVNQLESELFAHEMGCSTAQTAARSGISRPRAVAQSY